MICGINWKNEARKDTKIKFHKVKAGLIAIYESITMIIARKQTRRILALMIKFF